MEALLGRWSSLGTWFGAGAALAGGLMSCSWNYIQGLGRMHKDST